MPNNLFYASLLPEMLSINTDLAGAVALAAKYGFDGVDTSAGHLVAPGLDLSVVADALAASGLRAGYFGIPPGRVPATDADWAAALDILPKAAARAQRLGYRRAGLVVMPFHETRVYAEAFAEHVRRINAVMAILDDYDISLALEYVSPVTRRAPYPNTFAHDMNGMLALCNACDSPHVGLMLDTFHWHCAGETVADIERLTPDKVVLVHVNDAPDVPVETMTVGERAFPGATGVIDVASFVGALRTIGYDGPMTCEPMASAVAALGVDDDGVLRHTLESMRRVLS